MKKALKNLEKLFPKTSLGGRNFRQELKFWQNCFEIVQSMPRATKKFKAIARERDVEQLLDTLAEIKFAVIFNQLGFQVEIEPFFEGNNSLLHPDLKISKDNHSSIVEVKRFRPPGPNSPGKRMQNVPKDIPNDYVFPEIGDPIKDLQKIFNEVEKKFRQTGREGIIAIWNSNDELSPHEFLIAAHGHKKISERDTTASFVIIRADPWENFICAELSKGISNIHKRWKSDFEKVVPDKILQNILEEH